MQTFRQFALAGTVSLAFVAFAEPSAAFDPSGNRIADALFASIESGPAKITSVGSVSGSDSSVSISDLVVEIDNWEMAGSFRFASIELSDTEAMQDGRLRIGQSAISGLTGKIGPVDFTIGSINSTNLVIPSADDFKGGMTANTEIFYDRSELADIVVNLPTGGKIPVASAVFSYDEFKDGRPTAGSGTVTGAIVDPAALGDPMATKIFSDLGYGPISVSMSLSAVWDPTEGLAHMKSLKISADDVATVDLSFKFLGFTDEVQDMLTSAGDDQAKAMQAMQKISFSSLALRVENHSVVERVLEFVAKRQGSSPEQLKAGATQMLPLVLGGLKNPDLQAKITSAVTTFLADPKNLTAMARPEAPIPFAQLMGPAMMAPHTLPMILGFSIEANQ